MFLSGKALRRSLKKGLIVVENSFVGALNSMTIDVRLGGSILVPKLDAPLDPLGSDDQITWETVILPEASKENAGQGYVLAQSTLVLGYTHERIAIARNILAIINSRSTAARFGIIPHHAAPLINPGHGLNADGTANPRSVTLEISTTIPIGKRLYAGMVIAQLKFAYTDGPLDEAYDARPGASYSTDHGVMCPKLASLIPNPDAIQGNLCDIMGLRSRK